MSNSRLEKIIYAICGMEVDDLPTPLSRIETLWNCLITGEVPDFEPLSRNEKYLMAMLTDNVDGLPEPTSRSEKLLYKIATGETDLTDVPGYLSRYEELLKQLIENGGIGGTDFEYVLYTLNQPLSTLYTTAEGPVKSAILKGQTLVNVNRSNFIAKSNITTDYANAIPLFDTNMKASTTYTIIAYSDDLYNYRLSEMRNEREVGLGVLTVGTPFVYTTDIAFTGLRGYLKGDILNIPKGTEIKILIVEGDHSNEDIPYFEGMQSVKMPVLTTSTFIPMYSFLKDDGGANFTKLYTEFYEVTKDTFTFKQSGHYQRIGITTDNFEKEGKQTLERNKEYQFKIEILENTLSIDMEIICNSKYTDGVKRIVGAGETPIYEFSKTITSEIPEDDVHGSGEMILFYLPSGYNGEVSFKVTIGVGNINNIKSNILTVSDDVTLRGIGDVQDTLDCLTGEVTQRIKEVVLNGETISNGYTSTDSYIGEYARHLSHLVDGKNEKLYFQGFVGNLGNSKDYILTNGFAQYKGFRPDYSELEEGLYRYSGADHAYICISASRFTEHTFEGVKKFLKENPQSYLVTNKGSTVKTVVLSTLDQDGQPTKLSTFNDITHVSIEAEDLLPTVDLEVPTKIEETLSALSTLMNDISETQQSLNESIDAQAENINEVSTAITEIRSDIL